MGACPPFPNLVADGSVADLASRGLLFLLFASPCLSHKRLSYPTPRDTTTGSRDASPCGGQTFEEAAADGLMTEWTAGETVEIVVFQDIYHAGEPMRLAISGENDEDFESCIWLNVRSLSLSLYLCTPDLNPYGSLTK